MSNLELIDPSKAIFFPEYVCQNSQRLPALPESVSKQPSLKDKNNESSRCVLEKPEISFDPETTKLKALSVENTSKTRKRTIPRVKLKIIR